MAPVTRYVFAEMLGVSEHFTAGSHEWLPYSVIPTFPKLICKHQFIVGPALFCRAYSASTRVCSRPMRITVPSPTLDFARMVWPRRSQICLHRYSPIPLAR